MNPDENGGSKFNYWKVAFVFLVLVVYTIAVVCVTFSVSMFIMAKNSKPMTVNYDVENVYAVDDFRNADYIREINRRNRNGVGGKK